MAMALKLMYPLFFKRRERERDKRQTGKQPKERVRGEPGIYFYDTCMSNAFI